MEEPLGADPFAYMLSLSYEELGRRLAEAQLSGLVAHIWAAAEELRCQKATTGSELSAKFASEGSTFQMAFGSLSMFFGGLVMLIGPPKMVEGSLLNAMRLEHCGQEDSAAPFETSNGMEGVTSVKEWEFVMDPKADFEYSERGGRFVDMHPEWCRKPRSPEVFQEKMAELNAKLESKKHTRMVLEELIGGRLYTGERKQCQQLLQPPPSSPPPSPPPAHRPAPFAAGPMYEKYNAVLRFFSGQPQYASAADVPFLQKKCERLGLGAWEDVGGQVRWAWRNKYVTSIHAVNSCVLKL